jgi:hypothetical protein
VVTLPPNGCYCHFIEHVEGEHHGRRPATCQQASAGEIAPLRPASRARGCTSVASPSSSSRHHALPTVVELLISLTSSGSATSVAGSARRWRASETTQVAGGRRATHERARLLPLAGARRSWLPPPPFLCCYRARRDPRRHGTPPRRRRVRQPHRDSPPRHSSLVSGAPCPGAVLAYGHECTYVHPIILTKKLH